MRDVPTLALSGADLLIEQGLGIPGFRKELRPNDWREHWPELAATHPTPDRKSTL